MNIRAAIKTDIPSLSILAKATYAKAFGHSFNAEDLAAHLEKDCSESYFKQAIERDIILVAIQDQKNIVGYIKFGENSLPVQKPQKTDIELHRIFVDPLYQNQGIGTLLINEAFNHPVLKNASNLYLDVWEHNHDAQKFYERNGFKVIGKHKFKMPSGKDGDFDLIMVKCIN